MSHSKLERARFLGPAAQLEVPGAVITFSPLGLEGSSPSPQGRDADLKAKEWEEGEGGPRGWPLRQTDKFLSVKYTPSEKRGAGHTRCPFLSSLQPPSRRPGPAAYLSSPGRFAWGVRHALPSVGSGQSSGAADPPTHPSYSIPSRL